MTRLGLVARSQGHPDGRQRLGIGGSRAMNRPCRPIINQDLPPGRNLANMRSKSYDSCLFLQGLLLDTDLPLEYIPRRDADCAGEGFLWEKFSIGRLEWD